MTRCREEEHHNWTWCSKRPETGPSIRYVNPVGKSDHVMLEIKIYEDKVLKCKEDYKHMRRNQSQESCTKLKNFYGKNNWKKVVREYGDTRKI